MSFACYVFSIGKNVSYISLGTGPFALGTPPFTGGADSVEKPLQWLPGHHGKGKTKLLSRLGGTENLMILLRLLIECVDFVNSYSSTNKL